MQKRSVRIQDPTVRDAAGRMESFTRMMHKRLDEEAATDDRSEKTIALLEAEVAANLVAVAAQEIALRLISHGVALDPAAEIAKRLQRFRLTVAAFEATYGPIPRA